MALRGDDELDSLLSSWGQAPISTSGSVNPPIDNAASSALEPEIKPGDQQNKEKKKKRKKKRKHSKIKEGRNRTNNGDKPISFADTRLSQDCFEWPSSLKLGPGLLHDCKRYSVARSSKDRKYENGCYGSACQSCGKSAASHEMCLSPSLTEDADEKNRAFHPLSIMSVASIIVASRNARCLIGEHYPVSADEKQEELTHTDALSENYLLPPLNSISSSSESMSNALDVQVGRILVLVKKMQNESGNPNYRAKQHDNMNQPDNLSSIASISVSDAQLLQEKTSVLISAVQDYKKAITAVVCSPPSSNATNCAAICLVEKRLVAMASCDTVYYRCYYAAVVAHSSTDTAEDGSVMAGAIPHPPTYFSCPGLSWDVQNAGVESFRVFVGGCSNRLSLAAPLNESTKQVLLESWGLKERLSSTNITNERNPLLTLWQSRFLETIRHIWVTRYSALKTPISLRAASCSTERTNQAQTVPNDSQESQLKLNETEAISPEVTQWRDSVRDYPANFYAYATPTNEALQMISNCLGSSRFEQIIVEAGAGTGYWSALLLSHLNGSGEESKGLEKDGMAPSSNPVCVKPYDITPPSYETRDENRSVVGNEYHGNIPTFTDVPQANTFREALSTSTTSSSNMALLLCYPPPGNDMAQRALSDHISNGGCTVLHIGEWQGLTGNSDFEALLTNEFCCQEKDVVYLPCWGTDATYLTIWKKKGSKEIGDAKAPGTVSSSPAFGYCAANNCSNRARRRCRYARCLQYCSLECFGKHSSQRRDVLALHMMRTPTDDGLGYENDNHFIHLNHATVLETVSSNVRTKKKRKKKRR